MDNLLYKEIENKLPLQYKAYGIDHDRCFMGFTELIKIEYLIHPSFNSSFSANLQHLVSPQAQEDYAQNMKKFAIPNKAIKWMNYSCKILEKAILQGKNSRATIKELMQKWEEKLYT